MVKALLKQPNINPAVRNAEGDHALGLAAWHGHLEVVKLLANVHCQGEPFANLLGMHKDYPGHCALNYAAHQGHHKILDVLLEANGNRAHLPGQDGQTALHFAAAMSHDRAIKSLFHGAQIEVNHKNRQGQTALHLAAMNLDAKILESLLQHSDIDVNARNADGHTALYLAVAFEDEEEPASLQQREQAVHALVNSERCAADEALAHVRARGLKSLEAIIDGAVSAGASSAKRRRT